MRLRDPCVSDVQCCGQIQQNMTVSVLSFQEFISPFSFLDILFHFDLSVSFFYFFIYHLAFIHYA